MGGVVVLNNLQDFSKEHYNYLHLILTAHHVWWALQGNPNVKLINKDITNDLVLYLQKSNQNYSQSQFLFDDIQLTNDFVWSRIAPGLLCELQKRNPPNDKGRRQGSNTILRQHRSSRK